MATTTVKKDQIKNAIALIRDTIIKLFMFAGLVGVATAATTIWFATYVSVYQVFHDVGAFETPWMEPLLASSFALPPVAGLGVATAVVLQFAGVTGFSKRDGALYFSGVLTALVAVNYGLTIL